MKNIYNQPVNTEPKPPGHRLSFAENLMYSSTSFWSKKQIEGIHNPHLRDVRILISITTPFDKGCAPAVIDEDSWAAVLRLTFHDSDPKTRTRKKKTDPVLFSEADAYEILRFLKANETPERAVFVHCEAGISRSAAVSKFIAHIYDLDFQEAYSLYNRHVFTTLLRTYGKCVYDKGEIKLEDLPGHKDSV